MSRLTHDGEVDLGLPAAQLVLHQQRVAAAVLLARSQDGELAASLAVLHLDILALLDLEMEGGAAAGDSGQERKRAPSWLFLQGTLLDKLWGSLSCLDSEFPPKPLLSHPQGQASLRVSRSGMGMVDNLSQHCCFRNGPVSCFHSGMG